MAKARRRTAPTAIRAHQEGRDPDGSYIGKYRLHPAQRPVPGRYFGFDLDTSITGPLTSFGIPVVDHWWRDRDWLAIAPI